MREREYDLAIKYFSYMKTWTLANNPSDYSKYEKFLKEAKKRLSTQWDKRINVFPTNSDWQKFELLYNDLADKYIHVSHSPQLLPGMQPRINEQKFCLERQIFYTFERTTLEIEEITGDPNDIDL
jgi:hypothetical protein